MAQALHECFGIGVKDAISRLTRKRLESNNSTIPRTEVFELDVDGESHDITFYVTPNSFLKRWEESKR